MRGKLSAHRKRAQKRKDVWAEKWRELRKLVNKKYDSYISLVALELVQFQEGEGTQVRLTVRHHSFGLGAGDSRLSAIREALYTIKKNQELASPIVGIFASVVKDKVSGDKNLEEAIEIIKKCKF